MVSDDSTLTENTKNTESGSEATPNGQQESKQNATEMSDEIKDIFPKESLAEDETSPQNNAEGTADSGAAVDVDALQASLAKAEETAEKHWNDLLRTRAELDNVRRRAERDVENAHKYAVEKFVQALLPVVDSLEMGLTAANSDNADIEKLREGTELTLKLFTDCTQKFGIEVVNPVGEAFNPEFHQAMSMQESNEHEPNTVLAVMQKGYLLSGRLVRPAMVVVSKAGSGAAVDEKDTASSGQDNVEDTTVIGNNIDEKA